MTERTGVWVKLWIEDGKESKLFNSIKQMKGIELECYDRSTKPKHKLSKED